MTDRPLPPRQSDNTARCIICGNLASLSDVTAGSLYADGRQAFACDTHVTERLRWILAWAAFDAEQQSQEDTA